MIDNQHRLYHKDEVDAVEDISFWKGIAIGGGIVLGGFLLLLAYIAVTMPT